MTLTAFSRKELKAKELLGQWISERLMMNKCRFIPCILYIKTEKERDVFVTKTACYPDYIWTDGFSNDFPFSLKTGEQGKCEEGWMASLPL